MQDLQLDVSMAGMAVAAVSVISSGLQQIFVRTMQQKHKLSAHEMLSNTAPPQVLVWLCHMQQSTLRACGLRVLMLAVLR